LEQELRAPQRTGQQQSTAPRFNPTSMQAQLQSIEQQLMQEINGLQARVDQLWMVRALQGELARLRIAQANGTYGAGSSIGQPSTSAASMPVRTSIQAFGIDPHHGQTGAANDLPPGVTVPEGWTLMPLQRLGANSPFAPGPIAGPLEPTASAAQNAGPSQGTPMPAMAAPPPSAEPARLPTMATPGPEPRVEPIRIPSIHNQPIPSSIPRTSTLQIPSASRPPPVRTTSQTPHEGTGLLNVPADSRSGWGSPAPRSSFQEAEHDDSDAEEGPAASSAETRAAKGKGRAATIEDTSEDSD
jgi:E3 ubiquitin-protein ligase synoviolin